MLSFNYLGFQVKGQLSVFDTKVFVYGTWPLSRAGLLVVGPGACLLHMPAAGFYLNLEGGTPNSFLNAMEKWARWV